MKVKEKREGAKGEISEDASGKGGPYKSRRPEAHKGKG